MICAKCEQPMVKGYLPALRAPVIWLPEDVKPPILPIYLPKGGIKISETTWKKERKESYYCHECNIVVINLPPLNKRVQTKGMF